jgi:hypothetical protein
MPADALTGRGYRAQRTPAHALKHDAFARCIDIEIRPQERVSTQETTTP